MILNKNKLEIGMKITYTIFCKSIFALILLISVSLMAAESLSVKTLRGKSIAPYLHNITDLCVQIYKEYPYLYEGTSEEYFPFIEYYAQSENGIACLLFDKDRPVGVAIGMPINEMREKYKGPFMNARPHENLGEIFYLGEYLLLKDYRGKGLGKEIYLEFERSVKKNQNMKKICFCKIDESNQTNLEIENYKPLDGFWVKNGFKKCDDITVSVDWQNVGELNDSPHILIYWLKPFSKK